VSTNCYLERWIVNYRTEFLWILLVSRLFSFFVFFFILTEKGWCVIKGKGRPSKRASATF
jgi:hypothetical protein